MTSDTRFLRGSSTLKAPLFYWKPVKWGIFLPRRYTPAEWAIVTFGGTFLSEHVESL